MSERKRIERLMLFVGLAEILNFTKAAESLGVSKGFLSEQIKKLETELRCPLLIRTTRSVRLTQEGERAYRQGVKIRSQMLELERGLMIEHDEVSGLLKMTAPKMFAETYLFELCAKFKQKHPGISFEINSSYTTYNLSQQDIDLAFRATNKPPENMVATKLFSYSHLLVASPKYLDTYGRPCATSELNQHHCLATLHQREWPMKSGDIPVTGWVSTNENHILKQQALSGEGIIRIANYYVDKEIKKGLLEQVLTEETLTAQNSVYLFYPQVIYPSVKLKAFVSFVREYFI
ncbi:LysR family transcriptional regulator [Vibrio sp. HN007]|uniref:LysR family transcriptional regulator n=1 Tax=Vibrio iocasae TaxID=3098914 RepID=UPI0035D4E463